MNLPYYLSALIALFIAPRISKWLGKKVEEVAEAVTSLQQAGMQAS